jgi:peptidoglycan/LPS O-acetylase OafA/YrhL
MKENKNKMKFLERLLNILRLYPEYDKRIFGLDLMRALAIIFVVLGHGGSMLEKANTNFPCIRLIDGVELFFVLSGFLIGSILIKKFINGDSFGPKTIINFWIRRWFRTLPNYYLILVLNIIVIYFGIRTGDLSNFNWKFLLFLHNFSNGFSGFFWESWSLSIEEWFYIFFPIILFIFYTILKQFKVSKKLIFLYAILLFLFIPLLLRFFIASTFDVNKFWLGVNIYKVVIYRLDGIAFGLLGAFIKHSSPKFWHKTRNISFTLGIIISYTILYTDWIPKEFSTKVFKLFYQSIGCFLLLAKFDSIKNASLVITKVFTHISLISYSMYLINLGLVFAIIRDNFNLNGPYTAWISYLIYWAAVIMFSTLLYKYYERPFMNLRDKLKI